LSKTGSTAAKATADSYQGECIQVRRSLERATHHSTFAYEVAP
jgi:hypothetical protein